MTLVKLALVGLIASAGFAAHAADGEQNLKEDAKNVAHDTKVSMKKAGRKAQDETCEMVNGKMECAAKKAKHKVENAADDLKK